MGNKTKDDILYYNSEEYAERRRVVTEEAEQILAKKAAEAEQKKKEVKKERLRLKKIFTKERCGESNMHLVQSLIDRAAFLRVELEHIERSLQEEGMMDFFVQGVQTMWREHPLSKVHVQHSKSYRETVKQLESYGKTEGSSHANENPVIAVIQKGNAARGKYRQ